MTLDRVFGGKIAFFSSTKTMLLRESRNHSKAHLILIPRKVSHELSLTLL